MDKGPIEILEELLEETKELALRDKAKLDKIKRRTRMSIKNIFGESSEYIDDLSDISFYSMHRNGVDAWNEGQNSLINLIETMIEELERFGNQGGIKTTEQETNQVTESSQRVFVVHGHDEEMKQSVARTLENLELEPLILHERPNKGRSIIEKFEDYADVGFAVVLLSPDDKCFVENEGEVEEKRRARQNVILELGFFLGKLGRNRVMALHKETNDFEMPSDYDGVLYTPYDENGSWRFDLAQELNASGFKVNANELI